MLSLVIQCKVIALGVFYYLSKFTILNIFLNWMSGIASYYEEFMETLYSKTGEKIPIWAIGHAGHDVAGQEESIPSRLGKIFRNRNNFCHNWALSVPNSLLTEFLTANFKRNWCQMLSKVFLGRCMTKLKRFSWVAITSSVHDALIFFQGPLSSVVPCKELN